MTAPWTPPRPTYYLRIFVICLALVVLCLAGFLFGIRMEAVVPATGIIHSRDQQELRSPLTGLIEPGWYEGEIPPSGAAALHVRLDQEGNGITDPAAGPVHPVRAYELDDGRNVARAKVRFHALQPGDELWPDQVLAEVKTDSVRPRRAVVRVPGKGEPWLILKALLSRGQRVRAGDGIATLAPLDPKTRRPRDLVAHLEIDEKHCGDLAPGQTVRLYSTMYNHRHHGHATATLERIEPWGQETSNGRRRFRALAAVRETSDLHLPPGSTFQAEIVVGRKVMYRIILEH
jgi:hypothetical protein